MISEYCTSVRTKLYTSKNHLENLLAIKRFDASSSNIQTSNFSSGSTVGVGYSATVQVPSLDAMNLSSDLDGFFETLVSALDIFTHIINFSYFTQPKPTDKISFDYIVTELSNNTSLNKKPITKHLLSIKKANWFKEMKPYRRCAIHHKSIGYQIDYFSSIQPLTGFRLNTCDVKAILLPDNPLIGNPTFNKKRKVNTFCVRVEKRELEALDRAFNIIQFDISMAQRIPI